LAVSIAEKGFSNAGDVPTRALVDADRHVQTDVLTLPTVTLSSIRRVLQYPEGTDIDPRQIRALTSADIVTIANQILRDADGHGQIDVLTLPSIPAGTNTIGNVNAIKSGTWNIDNLLNPHPIQLTPEHKLTDGNQFSGTYSPTGAGSTTIISAVTGKVIRVYDFSLWNSGSADVTVELYFGTSGKRLFKGLLSAKSGVLKTYVRPWESNSGDSLVLALSAAVTCDYCIGAAQA
jgi:hypothetical protein